MTAAAYHNSDTEGFVMDDLGNRDGNQTLRQEGTVPFAVDPLTNRYTAIGKLGTVTYKMKICTNNIILTTAQYVCDALGRRVRKTSYDAVPSVATLYYYSDNWQVLAEHDGSDSFQAYYVFGNYIDEVLLMNRGGADKYYPHDHLYSPAALLDNSGNVIERYEYDAYGKVQILTSAFSPLSSSQYGNTYYFTGRELDTLDSGAYKKMHYRHRDYEPWTGRFSQPDPKGYVDSMSLYAYVVSNPVSRVDPLGLWHYPIHPLPWPPISPQKSRKELAKEALNAVANFHKGKFGYHYYDISGLDNLINGKLMPVLDWVNYGPSVLGGYASYWSSLRLMGINISESDLKGNFSLTVGSVVFHEAIHAYLHKNDLFQISSYNDDRLNEGIAHGAQYLLEEVVAFQEIEKRIYELDRGEIEWSNSVHLGLKDSWAKAWSRINRIPHRRTGWTNREAPWGGDSFASRN